MEYKRIEDNTYMIVPDDQESGIIIYAPLSELVLQCAPDDVARLEMALDGNAQDEETEQIAKLIQEQTLQAPSPVLDPKYYKKLSILSNYKCNLSCSYCYSAKGRSDKEISPDSIRAAIGFLLSNASEGEKLSLFFSGGGEPLLSWKMILPVLAEMLEKATVKSVNMAVHFMSNGTIYVQEVADFFKDNGITLCISYEILDRYQSSLRGKAGIVKENIRRYLANGNIVYISSTITPLSVSGLVEMVKTVAEAFPGIQTVTMEPVTGQHLFETPKAMEEFYRQFDDNFQKACMLAESHGIELNTSTKNITSHIVDRYCPGKLCLTPTSRFTICHCASSPNEDRYEKCTYGFIDGNGGVNFDIGKFRSLTGIGHERYPECKDCFARIHCGGECMTRRDTYAPEFMRVVCERTRRLILDELKESLR